MGDDARFSSAGKRQCRFPAILVFAATARAGFAVALLWSATARAELPATGPAFVQRFCVECHQPPKPKSGLDLTPYTDSAERFIEDALAWDEHLIRVREGEMPPDDDDVFQPSTIERTAFISWVEETLIKAAAAHGVTPGPPMLRRLNRTEYSTTLRNLLGVHVDAGEDLPSEGAGGEGFDNAAETLFISPIHAEKYLEAARAAVDYAFADTRAQRRFLKARPDDDTTTREAAEEVLEAFLPRAFRRPVTGDELAEYLTLFESAHETEGSYIAALKLVFSAILVSPKFLFILESDNPSPEPVPVTDHELATRLSYFLWGSSPDDKLLELAGQGRLSDADVLDEQIRRLLGVRDDEERGRGRRRGRNRDGDQIRNFAQTFVEQWLGTRALGREFKPDASIRGYDSELEGGMKYEPVFFFEEILRENRPLLDLLDSDYTYANRRLARHYGIKGEFREQPRRVELDGNDHRGGLLGMAAVLAVSSHPHRTSPVLRGKWILENLMGEPPPPPPPDVPELEESHDETEPKSLRERLEAHRNISTCAACHDRIDPLGFSLENYDVLGRWRDEESGRPVDAQATLPDGTEISGPGQLKEILLSRKDQIMRTLVKKMLGYALARSLTYEDYCVVDQIMEDLRRNDYRSHRLVRGIVHSVPFRFKAGTDPAIGVELKELPTSNSP